MLSLSFKHMPNIYLKYTEKFKYENGYNLLNQIIHTFTKVIIILYVTFEKIKEFHKKIWSPDLVRAHAS